MSTPASDFIAEQLKAGDAAQAELTRLRNALEDYIKNLNDTAYYDDARWAAEVAKEIRAIFDPETHKEETTP